MLFKSIKENGSVGEPKLVSVESRSSQEIDNIGTQTQRDCNGQVSVIDIELSEERTTMEKRVRTIEEHII
jgi:hypothetical protein